MSWKENLPDLGLRNDVYVNVLQIYLFIYYT